MVIAGPGSGKTTVIVQRIKFLIEKLKVPPENILVVTFTKNSAEEMRIRSVNAVPGAGHINIGTFHSIFNSMLRSAYGKASYRILDDISAVKIIKDIAKKYLGSDYGRDDIFHAVVRLISYVKATDSIVNVDISSIDSFKVIFEKYQEYLKEHRLLDFEDILIETRELLRDEKELARQREHFRFILVDEFQDINKVQYDIVRLLAAPLNNLFIVGDDDQSIYGFRGSDPGIMKGFPKDLPGCRQIILNDNYRCGENILKASVKLISNNMLRFKKELRASSGRIGEVRRHIVKSESDSGRLVAELVKDYRIRAGIRYEDIAVLYRTNTGAMASIKELTDKGIPFSVSAELKDAAMHFHTVYKDICAYLKLASGKYARMDFIRIMNRPDRGISREVFKDEFVEVEDILKYYNDNSVTASNLKDLITDLRIIRDMKPWDAILFILEKCGYDDWMKGYCERTGKSYMQYEGVAEELLKKADLCGSIEELLHGLYLEEKAVLSSVNRNEPGRVRLLTMHKAKGLEFDAVIIENVNEGIVPFKKARTLEAIEEERRMMYVAMTRARMHLDIISLRERYGRKIELSPFLKEI